MQYRLTSDAQGVMRLSHEEACRFNSVLIQPVHVLLGIVKQGSSDACRTLEAMGVNLRELCDLINTNMVQPAQQPDVSTAREKSLRTLRLIELAVEESRLLQCKFLGTEGLLLGLLSHGSEKLGKGNGVSMPAAVLNHFGVTLESARPEVEKQLKLPGRE